MTTESISGQNDPKPDYISGFPQPPSFEQIAYCEEAFSQVAFRLPADLSAETLAPSQREQFTVEVHVALRDILQERGGQGLPDPPVRQAIKDYYHQYPVGDADRVHELHKIAHQNRYITWARSNPHTCPEADIAWGLAMAYRARHLPYATASMFALLSAYGKAVELLGAHRVRRRDY